MNIFEQMVESDLQTLEPLQTEETTPKNTAEQPPNDLLTNLYNKRQQITGEIRLLKQSIHFFQDIIDANPTRIPEMELFKHRLQEAIRIRKGINLAITTYPAD